MKKFTRFMYQGLVIKYSVCYNGVDALAFVGCWIFNGCCCYRRLGPKVPYNCEVLYSSTNRNLDPTWLMERNCSGLLEKLPNGGNFFCERVDNSPLKSANRCDHRRL